MVTPTPISLRLSIRHALKPLICSGIASMILAPGIASAQDQAEEAALEAQEIQVTGSRIRVTGMDTPNPVTVVTQDEINFLSPVSMVEGLAELPQFYGSNTTQNTGGFFESTGAGTLNLRGLQGKRTLQLLDSRRVVPSTIFGGPDINLFPTSLVRTVETVTGGATAAYGTDAVAGAVNFILDTDYEGLKINALTGETGDGLNENYEVSIAGGFSFGENDRGHVLLSYDKADQDPIWQEDRVGLDWYNSTALMENPAPGAGDSRDNPFYLPYDQVVSRNASLDGILHFPAAAGGDYIFNQNGQASPFVPGDACSVTPPFVSTCSIVNGGSGTDNGLWNRVVTPDTGRENLFGYIDYDLTDQLTVYGQIIDGEAEFTNPDQGGLFVPVRYITVFQENPFLPDDVQQLMADNGIDSVPMGRIGSAEDINIGSFTTQETETTSYTAGFEYDVEGGFFDGWQVKGYYQKGETDVLATQYGGIRLDRIFLATDVVIDPGTGQPACNVTVVSGMYPDCVPLNLFGRGNASPEAIDWVTGFEAGVPMHADGFLSATESMPHDYVSGENKRRVINIEQDVWEISADGELFEGFGAGPVYMAAGLGQREESFTQVVEVGPGGNINADPTFRPVAADDPGLGIRGVPTGGAASGNSVEIQFSNVPFARGEQDVTEAFTEFLIPLLSGQPGVEQLNFSAATRWADYSGSGDVWSWKGGFDWTINDQWRLRSTVSQDVRAATMGEKFDRTGGLATVTDYLLDPTGDTTYGTTRFSNGSPDIRPEEARTYTVGGVYQPDWLEGLSISLDWFSVEITDNINQADPADVTSGCYTDGDVDLCSMITRGGPPLSTFPTGDTITLIGVPYYNQGAAKAEGVDLELDYRIDVDWFGGGEFIGLRLLGTYLSERSNTDSAGNTTEIQGDLGSPEWTSLLSGSYTRGPLSVSLMTRYTSAMRQNANWNHNGSSTRWDVADNEIDAEVLVDTRLNYRFDTGMGSLNVFATINNLFDKAPEPLVTTFDGFFTNSVGNHATGDLRGRRWTVGLNYEY